MFYWIFYKYESVKTNFRFLRIKFIREWEFEVPWEYGKEIKIRSSDYFINASGSSLKILDPTSMSISLNIN